MSDIDNRAIRVGPFTIRIRPEGEPLDEGERVAIRISQAAIECDDLVELVSLHPHPRVRALAVPRLKARFPTEESARRALAGAATDPDEGVRSAAVIAIGDLGDPGFGDLLAGALDDPDPDVRFFAAIGLQNLNDSRAPDDPEAFAYRSP
jgi:HEAT repeat protein